METSLFWAVSVGAAILVGLSKGGLPIVAMTSVPLMSLVMPPLEAAGLLLPIYIVSDWFGLYAYRHHRDMRVLAIMVPATAIGVALGWATASLVSERVVGGMIGTLGCAFAVARLGGWGSTAPARPARVVPGMLCGIGAGFTSFVSHSGGPPYQIYAIPLRMPKAVFAGTSTILFAWVNMAKLPAYWSLGLLSGQDMRVAALLAVPASLAVFLGVRLVRVLPETLFFRLILWALLLLSARLVWEAA